MAAVMGNKVTLVGEKLEIIVHYLRIAYTIYQIYILSWEQITGRWLYKGALLSHKYAL